MHTAAPDRYQLVRRVRSTTFVQSYEAVHPRRGGRFLVDVLVGLRGEPEARAAFEREATLMASLRHPYVQPTLEIAGLPDGTPIAVSELPRGTTLQAWLDAAHDLPVEVALTVITALADALAAAHGHDVSHGDVSAENIVLVPGSGGAVVLPKLRGFGLRWAPGALRVTTAMDARAADLAALAALAERLLAPTGLNADAAERSFLVGADVSAVLARARGEGGGERFASPVEFATALSAVVATSESAPESASGARLALAVEADSNRTSSAPEVASEADPEAASEAAWGDAAFDAMEPAPAAWRRWARPGLGIAAGAAASVLVLLSSPLGSGIHRLIQGHSIGPARAQATVSPALVVSARLAPPPAAAPVAIPEPSPVAEPPSRPSEVSPEVSPEASPAPAPASAPTPASAPAPARIASATRRRAPVREYRGLVWSARLQRAVEVDDQGLPLHEVFPAPGDPVADHGGPP